MNTCAISPTAFPAILALTSPFPDEKSQYVCCNEFLTALYVFCGCDTAFPKFCVVFIGSKAVSTTKQLSSIGKAVETTVIKKTGGRLDTTATRRQIQEISTLLESRGYTITLVRDNRVSYTI